MASLAGFSARLAAVPAADLDRALVDAIDDVVLHVEGDRWTLAIGPRECLGGRITPTVVEVVEQALTSKSNVPVVVTDEGSVTTAIGVAAVVGGEALGVLVIERFGHGPWDDPTLGFVRAVGDILGGGLARRRAELLARRAEDHFRRLLETSAEGVCVLDPDGVIRFANASFADLVGATSVTGAFVLEFLPGPDGAQVAARLLHENTKFELELRRRDGTTRWVACSTSSLHEDAVDGSLALVMFSDISVRRATEAALRRSEARFRALIRASSDVIVVTDETGMIAYASPAVRDVLGHDPAALQGTSPFALVHADDAASVQEQALALWDARVGTTVIRARIRAADGSFVPMESVLTNLVDDAAVAGMTITARDIREQLAVEETLKFDATHDAVTGLANRRMFNQHLNDVLGRQAAAVTVLFADLDGFKAVNDSHGHLLGDELLRIVGARLQKSVREGDMVARHGGDEFAILCPGLARGDEVDTVAQRICDAVRVPIDLGGVAVRVGVSVGVASSAGGHRTDARRLIAAADDAMYEAKSTGDGWRYATSVDLEHDGGSSHAR